MEKRLQIKPVFVKTGNVRAFEGLMEGLELSAGEGRLGLVYGRAGRGKTRTAQWWHGNTQGSVFLRCLSIWRHSELGFLQALCRELGVIDVPYRKSAAFIAALDAIMGGQRTILIEEIEKLPYMFLELVRDLSDLSGAAIVLVGEEELLSLLRRNRRVWSRTYRQVEFKPIEAADIITYAVQAAGMKLSADVAAILLRSSEGDFRIVKRDLIALVDICNTNGTVEPDAKMAGVAVKRALSA